MKILLSLNYKLFKLNPIDFVNFIGKVDKANIIKGFEVNINFEEDKVYLKNLAKICNEKKYILRLHAKSFSNFNDCMKYLDFINEITNIYMDSINIVFHPLNRDDLTESLNDTNIYMSKIFKYIEFNKYNNIEISIENLNNLGNVKRLKKENFEDILKENQNLKFTYDIGHELIDGKINSNLNNILSERLNNVHIHSYRGIEDHYPIDVLDNKSKLLKQSISDLKKINFDGYIVAEYAIDYIDGNDFEEKLTNYINHVCELKNILEI